MIVFDTADVNYQLLTLAAVFGGPSLSCSIPVHLFHQKSGQGGLPLAAPLSCIRVLALRDHVPLRAY
ncbi:hypothetical protein ES703_114548 [subsurface metagenome]